MIAEFPISQPSTFRCTGHNLPQSVHAHGHVDKPGTAVMWTIVIDAEKKCIALRVRWAFAFIKFIQANGTPTEALNILEDFGCKWALVRGVSSTRLRQPLIPFKVGLAIISCFFGNVTPLQLSGFVALMETKTFSGTIPHRFDQCFWIAITQGSSFPQTGLLFLRQARGPVGGIPMPTWFQSSALGADHLSCHLKPFCVMSQLCDIALQSGHIAVNAVGLTIAAIRPLQVNQPHCTQLIARLSGDDIQWPHFSALTEPVHKFVAGRLLLFWSFFSLSLSWRIHYLFAVAQQDQFSYRVP